MENSTKSKIALGLILGVAAGAAVYYFMTNENGKQQLSDVIDAVKDFSDKAKNTAIEQSSRLAEQAANTSSKLASKASDVTSRLAESAKSQVEQIG
ncbi:YtxH domain-containing protein [Pedobacter alpinus]|uniref:YtxH domain-containing protein n=1 Tax=Pedobacter alpinus TaxID=1590643 RepID=A0ABW5TXT3_9SPHI